MTSTYAPATVEEQLEIERFLVRESALLDSNRHSEWLALLDDNFVYRVPVPIAREEPDQSRYDDVLEFANESKSFLTMRFSRVSSDYAWAERPSAYTRHFVSNFQVEPDGDNAWTVRTNVLVVRARLPEDPVMATAERVDRIERHAGGLLLHERTVYLDAEVPNESQLGVIY